MRFVWFWTFWHWSKESFRSGSLLRNPLHGVGSHWDEWFRHEASENDLRAIEEALRSESTQRQFIAWLFRHWAREMDWSENRMVPRFVLGQLAQVPPFNKWRAFEDYRTGYGVGGISAVVLGAESPGRTEDVRRVEALLLPAADGAPAIVPEGFQADAGELETARRAAKSLLKGKGLLVFLALWMAAGHRPYARWMKIALGLAWLTVGGLILFLLKGSEPGAHLFLWSAILAGLWSGLVLIAVTVAAWQGVHALRQGAAWSRLLEQSQVRMRMNGGLTLKGESAGLPFCLNTLLAIGRAEPASRCRSWLWRAFLCRLRAEANSWAATGVVTANGHIRPVVLKPKLRACLQHDGIKHILTPHQRDGGQRAVHRAASALSAVERTDVPVASSVSTARLGFAAVKPSLRTHCCRHVAQSVMALGGFTDSWQMAVNAFAVVVSAIMLIALPDLRSILLPHPAPVAVAPASSSPYSLWVSLDTKHPEYFSVVLESGYWSNRRSDVKQREGVTPSVRAEIHLHRLIGRTAENEENGTVWVERRRRFLTREFLPGERVGRYSISYLSHIGHE